MTCQSAQGPEPVMTESLVSLLAHGARMQRRSTNNGESEQAATSTVHHPNHSHRQQQSPEERRLRLRRVLEEAIKLTSEGVEDEEGDDLDSLLGDIPFPGRQ